MYVTVCVLLCACHCVCVCVLQKLMLRFEEQDQLHKEKIEEYQQVYCSILNNAHH